MKTAAAICIAALFNILPLLLFNIGGDIDFHLVLIKCFAGQFWQGDLYPRWCMEANGGLGSPLPLFYFPLPYYVAALLYPLSYTGLSLHGVYVLGLFIATCATALACFLWLSDIVSPGCAWLAGLLFIFLPYRMEAMLFRSSYSEVWGMALLPLVFKYARRMAQGDKRAGLPLAAVFGLLCITHLPSAAVAAMGGGLYMLCMARKTLWRYAASGLWGGVLAAFYIVPAMYYQRFLVNVPLFISGRRSRGWPNTFLHMDNVHYQTPLVLAIALTILALALLAFYVIRRRDRVADSFISRETCAWGIISTAALVLLFPVSAPFYDLLGPLKEVVFPWRMQSLFMLALAFFSAIWMQWLADKRKTWKADFLLLLAFLALVGCFVSGMPGGRHDDTIAEGGIMAYPEYRTVWTDEGSYNYSYFLSRYAQRSAIHEADVISGSGTIAVERWAWDGIILHAQSQRGMTVRLNQLYFPAWSAKADDGAAVSIRPEPHTGQMLADIPAGAHRILLHYSIYTIQPWLMLADVASILAALALMYRMRNE